MRPPGVIEIILILVIIFIIFGAGKLPQLFEMVGRGLRVFRREKKSAGSGEGRVTPKSKKKTTRS
jgi:TatA/E family protein of Tat protein translocase